MPNKPQMTKKRALAALRRAAETIAQLEAGLNGQPFNWRGVDAQHREPIVRELGFTLVSKSYAKTLGYELIPGAAPVGVKYFGAPISRFAEVYILECQCRPVNTTPPEKLDAESP